MLSASVNVWRPASNNSTRARDPALSRWLLRRADFLLQNCAILRRALQRELVRFTYEKRAMQRCEKTHNSLGLNYKSAALNQLSYAGIPTYESRF